MRALFVTMTLFFAGCGGDGGAAPVDGGGGGDGGRDGAVLDGAPGPDGPPVDPLAGIGAVTRVGGTYMFTEGPQWRAATGDFLFSDIPANTIYRWQPGGGAPVVFRMPSGNSNGLATDNAGLLLAAEHGNRRVSRGDGADPSSVVERFENKQLNSPNDLVVRGDGTIYFTDPPYGLPRGDPSESDLGFMGIFRVAPGGAVTAERRGAATERPNGIALSPDQRVLYVADTSAALVRAFDVAADGSLSAERTFVTTANGPDGMAVDVAGNVFVTTSAGVEVFAPDGQRWGAITVPMQPANAAFGGPDDRTLLITARTGVYQVTLANPGLPRN